MATGSTRARLRVRTRRPRRGQPHCREWSPVFLLTPASPFARVSPNPTVVAGRDCQPAGCGLVPGCSGNAPYTHPKERNWSAPSLLNPDKFMTPDDEVRAPQRHPRQCQGFPATVPDQGYRIAVLACLVLLLLPSVALSAPRILTSTVQGGSSSGTILTLTAKDARLLPLPGVHAQAIAYAADRGKPFKKVTWEFFLEFLDLALKVLVSICFVKTILDAVKLWLDQRAAARQRKELRICPGCYNLVRRRNATRCPYCRVELAPESRITTSPPRPESDRYERAREEPVRRTHSQQPVREEPVREDRRKTRGFEGPIREEPVRQESPHKERVRVEPIHEDSLREGPQEQEGEEWEEEEWELYELEREDQARRRKELIYAIVIANIVGWVAAGLLLLLHLL